MMFPEIDDDIRVLDLAHLFYVDIPTPFKRGDILYFRNQYGEEEGIDAFVLDSLSSDDPKLHERYLRGEIGDGSDLMGNGYFVNDSGFIYWDHAGVCDYFEYYTDRLEGKERILHYVSLFIKDKIGIPELLTMQSRIFMEHHLDNDLLIVSHGCYISENLRAENRLSEEDVEQIKQGNSLAPWVAGKLSLDQVKFLVDEFDSDMESTQMVLVDGGGGYLGRCANVVHQENHYERLNDSRFNADRRSAARAVLAAYDYTEDGWTDSYRDEPKK
jgi:hypothetical protein